MYGILISLGILSTIIISEKLAKKEGLDAEILWSALPPVLTAAIIGARIYHVLDFWNYYLQNPLLIFAVWRGGLGIFGGMLFGAAALIAFLKVKKQPILNWLNIIAVSVPLAQAIGRMGNFFNKELYGTGPIPFFALEALLDLLLFSVLFTYFNKFRKDSLGIYLVGYGIIRFSLEFFRTDSWRVGDINIAQVLSVVFILSGIWILRKSGGDARLKP